MKVAIVGTGYVGLVSGTCFSELGHQVTCIEINPERLGLLEQGKSPIYESGLQELMNRNIEKNRLTFTKDHQRVNECEMVFLAVGTPSSDDGSANLKYLFQAAKDVLPSMPKNAFLVIKSTVPVGTAEDLTRLVHELGRQDIVVINNPEFLKEGNAVQDFLKPDRVVVGTDDSYARERMEKLYRPLLMQGNPILFMSNKSAELTKYAANSFLATKISFINEIARLCDLCDADIDEVRNGIKTDHRIGPHFLYPGPGYGGSCFPKDLKALIKTGREHELEMQVINAAEEVNNGQKEYIYQRLKSRFNGELKGKRIALWGVAFKANTDDIRESSALYLTDKLLSEQVQVHAYDPVALDNYRKHYQDHQDRMNYFNNMYDCLKEVDALVVITEWSEFKNPDYEKMRVHMNNVIIFDTRNVLNSEEATRFDFSYFGIGKKA
jgi:UDPglucose 6-dehydrogenase